MSDFFDPKTNGADRSQPDSVVNGAGTNPPDLSSRLLSTNGKGSTTLVPFTPSFPSIAAGTAARVNPVGLLRALRRKWMMAVTLGLVAAALGWVGIWFFLPDDKFLVYNQLYMPVNPLGNVYTHPEAGSDFNTFKQTQMASLLSPLVLRAALRNPKVKELNLETIQDNSSPMEWLGQNIKVDFSASPEFMRVSMKGDDPEVLKVLVNAVTEAYLKEVVSRMTGSRQTHLKTLEDIHADYRRRLNEVEKTRNTLIEALGTGDNKVIALKQQYAEAELGAAQQELFRLENELRHLDVDIKTQERSPNKGVFVVPEAVLNAQIDRDLQSENRVKAKLEHDLAVLTRILDDENPLAVARLQKAKKAIEDHNVLMEKRRQELRGLYTPDAGPDAE